jgi:hypothetical protein
MGGGVVQSAPAGIGGGCANIATVVESPGGPRWLLGSVSDDPYDIRTRVIVDQEPGGMKYVATELSSVAGQEMSQRGYVVNEGERGRGVNQAGVGFTWAFAQESDAADVPGGVSSGQFGRLVLSKCGSVVDVLRLIESLFRAFSGVYFFADAQGDFAQVEISRRAVQVTKRSSSERGGVAINVNCFQDLQEYQESNGSINRQDAPNAARFRAAEARLAALRGTATLEDIARILADHENIEVPPALEPWIFPGHGFSICNHGTFGRDQLDPRRVPTGSVSAEIIDPVSRTLWYCYGWPCGSHASFGDQLHQEGSWGRFLPFRVAHLPLGYHTTLLGDLTPLAVKHLEFREAVEVDVRDRIVAGRPPE